MTPWANRPVEERALLNPSFGSVLVWHAARGYSSAGPAGLPFELAFLVMPLVLHRATRNLLPKKTSTSLAAWLEENPLSRALIGSRAKALAEFSREGLMFGGLHGLLSFDGSKVFANQQWKGSVNRSLPSLGEEVRDCVKRAEFLGKWFAKSGSPGTVMALIGVRA